VQAARAAADVAVAAVPLLLRSFVLLDLRPYAVEDGQWVTLAYEQLLALLAALEEAGQQYAAGFTRRLAASQVMQQLRQPGNQEQREDLRMAYASVQACVKQCSDGGVKQAFEWLLQRLNA
jgi:hypothetical protein